MIIGTREFWGRDFAVTSATLVPRPETELIVEEALRILPCGAVDDHRHRHRHRLSGGFAGGGAAGCAGGRHRPLARRTARRGRECPPARRRATASISSARISPDGLSVRADLIVSNPPYVPAKSAPALLPDVRDYEPAMALFGGTEGLEIIERLLARTAPRLVPGGTFIVEFGYGQEDSVRAAATREGWTVARILDDLQGIARSAVLGRSCA